MHSDFYRTLRWLETPPADFRAQAHAAVDAGNSQVTQLRRLAQYGMSEAQLVQLGRAFDRSRTQGAVWGDLTPFRLIVLSNSTTDHLHHPLVASALRYGLNLEVLSIAYEAAFAAALGGDERVRAFAPDAVLVAFDVHGLPFRELIGQEEEAHTIASCQAYIGAVINGARANFGAMCIAQTMATPPHTTFGSADRTVPGTAQRVLLAVNEYIAQTADVVFDLSTLAATVGTAQWFDARLFHSSKIPFALGYVPLYADHVARMVGALRGKSRRVLVLDLDNTLWGGVVGDDGMDGIAIGNGSATGEAFLAVQRKALALRSRGVLLAVASKNEEENARRPFRERTEMLLREDSFAAFQANWQDKAANIQAIAHELSLGLESMVFFDDNPAERALVRTFLPEVAVPELPADPSGFAQVLDAAGYFEAVTFSEEDRRRAELYQSRRAITQLESHDLTAYLTGLEMRLEVMRVHDKNRPRVTQLVNKSNQFNLTTRRFTEAEVRALESDARSHLFAFGLVDRLDDHGLISVIFSEQVAGALDITLWVMSCRVIGRGVERSALAHLVEHARALDCHSLSGWYLPTARNGMVQQHYETLGFTLEERREDGATFWRLDIASWQSDTATPIRLVVSP